MDRKEYLELCQKASKCHSATILPNIPRDLVVKYATLDFCPIGYKLSFENGKPQHAAILKSLTANSVIECSLDKVERGGENG